jgi:hypothetical protein
VPLDQPCCKQKHAPVRRRQARPKRAGSINQWPAGALPAHRSKVFASNCRIWVLPAQKALFHTAIAAATACIFVEMPRTNDKINMSGTSLNPLAQSRYFQAACSSQSSSEPSLTPSNSGVLRYRSPVSGNIARITEPFSTVFATSNAAASVAPDDMPTKIPSSAASCLDASISTNGKSVVQDRMSQERRQTHGLVREQY